LLPENQFAFDLYQKIKALGADVVFELMDLKLTVMEAENLLEKMVYIENVINEFQQESDAATGQ